MNVKVYLIFLKEDSSLYAFTTEKDIRDKFKLERANSLYIFKTKKMHEDVFQVFQYKNNDKILFTNILSDGERDLSFTTTYKENDELDVSCRKIMERCENLFRKLSHYHLLDKYRKDIEACLDYVGLGDMSEPIAHIDTFHLFMEIFNDKIFNNGGDNF